jgi:hypothetical protein
MRAVVSMKRPRGASAEGAHRGQLTDRPVVQAGAQPLEERIEHWLG